MNLDRKIIPSPDDNKLFSFPKYEKIKLNETSHLIYSYNDKLPVVQIIITIKAGSKFVVPEKNGLSQLTSMMLDEGAGPYNALELNNKIENLGIRFTISSNDDNIFISILSLNENLDEVFQILNYVLTEPHFNEQDFEREKRKLLTSISQRKDNPDTLADLGFYHSVFSSNNPYRFSKSGYTETVKNISVIDLKDFYNKHFTKNGITVSVCGNIKKDYLLTNLYSILNKLNSNNLSVNHTINLELFNSSIYLINKPDSTQSEIRIGHQDKGINNKDVFAKQLANLILGGQFTSRLNLNLREKRGFTYGVSSNFDYMQELGLFRIQTSVSNENTVETISEILKEMKGMGESIYEEELSFVKSSSIKRLPLGFETNSQIASNYLNIFLLNLPDDYYNNYVNNISNIKLEDVLSASKKYIKAENSIIVICGDSKKYMNDLNSLNLDIKEISIEELI